MSKRSLLFYGFIIFLACPVLYGLFVYPGVAGTGMDLVMRLSRLGALWGLFLFVIQIILGTKIRFIETSFGHDKMIELHRWFGLVALFLITFHAAVSIVTASARGTIGIVGLIGGIVAFFLFLFMLAFIVIKKIFPQSRYDFWEIAHELNYGIVPLAFIHSMIMGSSIRFNPIWQILWGLIGLAFLGTIGYKIWNYYLVCKFPFRIEQVTQENANVWTLRFDPRKVVYKPGQFMVMRLMRDGIPTEPHPFTIASSPTDPAFSVSIKAAGDFTNAIGEVKPGESVLIDAPYGRFSFVEFPSKSYVFIAGGIGITPFLSMLRYIRDKNLDLEQKVVLIWGNRTEKDIIFNQEIDQMDKYLANVKVVHVLSEPEEGWEGEKGFITADLIGRVAEDIKEAEVFVCGPPVMLRLVIKGLRSLGVSRRSIHYEKFSW